MTDAPPPEATGDERRRYTCDVDSNTDAVVIHDGIREYHIHIFDTPTEALFLAVGLEDWLNEVT